MFFQSQTTSMHCDDISTHWVVQMLRHDASLDAAEVAPTGDDYNDILPSGLGCIWHNVDDAAELASYSAEITRMNGAIIKISPNGSSGFTVIFAITMTDYTRMRQCEPDVDEWLDMSPLAIK